MHKTQNTENTALFTTINWVPELKTLPQSPVPIDVYYHPDALDGSDQLHFYPGMGEESLAASAAVRKLGELGVPAIVPILPYDKRRMPAADSYELNLMIDSMVKEAPGYISRHMNVKAGRQTETPNDLGGKSAGGVVTIQSAGENAEPFSTVFAGSPAGLNNEFLGADTSERYWPFLGRLFLKNGLLEKDQSIFHDKRNVRGSFEIVSRAVKDYCQSHKEHGQSRLRTKINYALSADLAPIVAEILQIKGEDFAVFVAENDKLFPPNELEASLAKHGAEGAIHRMPGSHPGLYANSGDPQIKAYADWVTSRRLARETSQQIK